MERGTYEALDWASEM
jgi:Na+/H+-translocating membrane pyrophosphatase